MRPFSTYVARSVVFVCVFSTHVSCVKTDEPIEMPRGGRTLVGPRNLVFDVGRDLHQKGALFAGSGCTCRPFVKYMNRAKMGLRWHCRPLPDHFGHLLEFFHRQTEQSFV